MSDWVALEYHDEHPIDAESRKLMTISVADYLATTGKSAGDFSLIGIESSDTNRIWSGGKLPPMKRLQRTVRRRFLLKLPKNTVGVFSVHMTASETPAGFFNDGLQFVSYAGTALVANDAPANT